jgi:hypothetical protein
MLSKSLNNIAASGEGLTHGQSYDSGPWPEASWILPSTQSHSLGYQPTTASRPYIAEATIDKLADWPLPLPGCSSLSRRPKRGHEMAYVLWHEILGQPRDDIQWGAFRQGQQV